MKRKIVAPPECNNREAECWRCGFEAGIRFLRDEIGIDPYNDVICDINTRLDQAEEDISHE